ncbi:TraK family protein [Aquipseudomonas alcaligenes]|uniref:TraK family protein n=1 Tax=Aquipseudomonas alcaligenes TaxID=43263 RepID=A0AB73I2H0_AQUAC|nr:TraK family protein [Pseudomonas alcaligenes]MDH0144414.1 TraK family protein [Pseudomonas alcaligenes]MEE1951119.1 TraK family protein [Pseudomonas alcaligenes]
MDAIDTRQRKSEKPALPSLSQRIAARVQLKPGASIAARNRSAFLAFREEIQQAYSDGWSLLAIWKLLHEEQRIPFTYQAFRRYARQLIDATQPSQRAVQSLACPKATALNPTTTKERQQ